jgi:hypothetical protein
LHSDTIKLGIGSGEIQKSYFVHEELLKSVTKGFNAIDYASNSRGAEKKMYRQLVQNLGSESTEVFEKFISWLYNEDRIKGKIDVLEGEDIETVIKLFMFGKVWDSEPLRRAAKRFIRRHIDSNFLWTISAILNGEDIYFKGRLRNQFSSDSSTISLDKDDTEELVIGNTMAYQLSTNLLKNLIMDRLCETNSILSFDQVSTEEL